VTPEEIFLQWAPAQSIWSTWAIPVPFAQIPRQTTTLGDVGEAETFELPAVQFQVPANTTVILDLPGPASVGMALALAQLGMRPVPVIDGSPGSSLGGVPAVGETQVRVQMGETLRKLSVGARVLQGLSIAANARPVFVLDALRHGNEAANHAAQFDNRWKTFPEDFPAAQFIQEQGITTALLVQEKTHQPSEDLAHVLLRWEEAGIQILAVGTEEPKNPRVIRVARPMRFRALWYRALELLGLQNGLFDWSGDWPRGSGG